MPRTISSSQRHIDARLQLWATKLAIEPSLVLLIQAKSAKQIVQKDRITFRGMNKEVKSVFYTAS